MHVFAAYTYIFVSDLLPSSSMQHSIFVPDCDEFIKFPTNHVLFILLNSSYQYV